MQTKTVPSSAADIQIGIEESGRFTIVKNLSRLLADEHVLYVKLRNYHWNVTGPYFQPLHAFFQEQYTEVALQIDEIAERIRSLGHFAPGAMSGYLEQARLQETGHLDGNAQAMLKQLLADHELIVRSLRVDLETAMELGDAGTSDFLTGLMEIHEKMAWMVRAHL
ncbi:MAG: DNA starvation/stationary phase protection protein [Saprospiraceae bacterium]|nr:DNA starvation/stationary phase protection protein [Saprospiraceae bacterium]